MSSVLSAPLQALVAPRAPVDDQCARDIDQRLATKTMPGGALGKLQHVTAQLARIEGNSSLLTASSKLSDAQAVVFAADHGLSMEPISAYPREVTWQMVLNIVHGGAAISVLCRHAGMPLWVANLGVDHRFDAHPNLLDRPVARGSGNCLHGDALLAEQVEQALVTGAGIVDDCQAAHPSRWVVLGEMGIGNTSIASLMLAALLAIDLERLIGRGTGLDDTQLGRKREVLQAVRVRHADIFRTPSQSAPAAMDVARAVGGLEILGMAGAMLRAAQLHRAILVDGFIATAAAAFAMALQPQVRESMVFTHCSAEAGHRIVLDALRVEPLLELGLRLGEGSGAALAVPLLAAGRKILLEMASFESASVAQRSAS